MYENHNLVETPKRNALCELTNSQNGISPNANLKLLTSVALQYPTPPSSTPQRKEKSLQILCDRFLDLYPLNSGNGAIEIQLDCTASQLGVEKRRMYDIINILEAMQCAVHRRKNTYVWHGGSRLNSFLRMLKKQGEHLCLSAALRGKAPKPSPPKQKTLGVLAQRFLMLFLVEPAGTYINLEMAVSVLIDASQQKKLPMSEEQLERQHKSKVRRLYDIANVLISIGLIEKVSGNTVLKKPVFRYRGPTKHTKAPEKVPVFCDTPSPVTPLNAKQRGSLTISNAVPARGKRKLIFTNSPASSAVQYCNDSPPPTPSYKWNEILQVVDMELNKLNGLDNI